MENLLKNFGKKVKLERIKNDLSQEQLASLLKVSTRTISLIENGKQHPKFFLVAEMVKVFHISVDELLKGIE
ncbi:helix-turn-helix transcriptional regulator [bacterium]|nr:helix-turn-helix transcriptional regulator [bacterium]